MTHSQVFEKVSALVRPFVKDEVASMEIHESTLILEDLRVNSARMVDIILELEDCFGIAIDDDAVDGMKTMGDVTNYICSKLPVSSAAAPVSMPAATA